MFEPYPEKRIGACPHEFIIREVELRKVVVDFRGPLVVFPAQTRVDRKFACQLDIVLEIDGLCLIAHVGGRNADVAGTAARDAKQERCQARSRDGCVGGVRVRGLDTAVIKLAGKQAIGPTLHVIELESRFHRVLAPDHGYAGQLLPDARQERISSL